MIESTAVVGKPSLYGAESFRAGGASGGACDDLVAAKDEPSVIDVKAAAAGGE